MSLVLEVFQDGLKDDSIRESAVFHAILKHLLGGATKEDADLWVALARKTEKRGKFINAMKCIEDILLNFVSKHLKLP